MRKLDLVKIVGSKYKKIHPDSKITIKETLKIVNLFLDELKACIMREESVCLKNLVVFKTYVQKSKKRHNPKRPELNKMMPDRKRIKAKISVKMQKTMAEHKI